MPKRIHIFYSIQRSGSTPLARILAHYLAQAENRIYLDEFFNHEIYSMEITGHRISSAAIAPRPPGGKYSFAESAVHVRHRQAELLKSIKLSDHDYCLKMFADNDFALDESFDQLAEWAQFIFILRRNLFEHLLSFLLSFATQKFYRAGGLRFEPQSIVAQKVQFKDFLLFQSRIKQRHRLMPACPTVYYEDFVASGHAAVLKAAGFQAGGMSQFVNSERQNSTNKLNLFSNQKDIISWYKNSSLNELFPIPHGTSDRENTLHPTL